MVAWDGNLYVIGGVEGSLADSNFLTDVVRFDCESGHWIPERRIGFGKGPVHSQGDTPARIAYHTATLVGGRLFLFGGLSGIFPVNRVSVLELGTMQWIFPPYKGQPPAPRAGHSATLIGSFIYFIGGELDGTYLNDIYRLNVNSMEWTQINASGKPPSGRAYHTAVAVDSKRLLIFGGVGLTGPLNDVIVLDIQSEQWSHISCAGKKPEPRHSHAATILRNCMYICGGESSTGTVSDTCVLDCAHFCWFTPDMVQAFPSRSQHAMSLVGTKIYVYGGREHGRSRNEIWLLDCGGSAMEENTAVEKAQTENMLRMERESRQSAEEKSEASRQAMLAMQAGLAEQEVVQQEMQRELSHLRAEKQQLTDVIEQMKRTSHNRDREWEEKVEMEERTRQLEVGARIAAETVCFERERELEEVKQKLWHLEEQHASLQARQEAEREVFEKGRSERSALSAEQEVLRNDLRSARHSIGDLEEMLSEERERHRQAEVAFRAEQRRLAEVDEEHQRLVLSLTVQSEARLSAEASQRAETQRVHGLLESIKQLQSRCEELQSDLDLARSERVHALAAADSKRLQAAESVSTQVTAPASPAVASVPLTLSIVDAAVQTDAPVTPVVFEVTPPLPVTRTDTSDTMNDTTLSLPAHIDAILSDENQQQLLGKIRKIRDGYQKQVDDLKAAQLEMKEREVVLIRAVERERDFRKQAEKSFEAENNRREELEALISVWEKDQSSGSVRKLLEVEVAARIEAERAFAVESESRALLESALREESRLRVVEHSTLQELRSQIEQKQPINQPSIGTQDFLLFYSSFCEQWATTTGISDESNPAVAHKEGYWQEKWQLFSTLLDSYVATNRVQGENCLSPDAFLAKYQVV